MARKRQARRCKAHRTDGRPCKAYSALGTDVCSAHGGNAPQVRAAGLFRYWQARTTAAFDQAWERHRRELSEWQARRFIAAACILGIGVEDVHPGHLLFLAGEGQIPGEDDAPRLRVDRRYGPRSSAQLATRAARQAARKDRLARTTPL